MPRDAAPSRRRAASLTMLSSYFTTAFGVITGIVLVPVYLRHFSMATYGAWLASGGLVTMLGLVDGGLSIVIGQRLSHSVGTTNTHALARVAGTGWAVISGACGLLLLLGLGVAPHVPAWIHAPAADHGALTEAFVLAAIGTACALAQTNLLSYAHAWQTTGVVATTNLITLTACVVAALGALANGAGVVALGFATAVRGALGLVIAVVFVGHDWRRRGLPPPHLDRAELHTQLRLTAPVFVGRFGGVALGNGESALVAAFINPEAAAVLALTGKVYGVCQSLINPIAGSAFLPLAHLAGSSSKGRVGVVVRELFALSGVLTAWVCAMALVGNAPFMTLWVGPEAYGGFWLSALLCVNTVAITRLNLLGMVLPGLGVLGAPSLAALAELGIRLGLLGLLLPALGMVGVPLATLLSMLCTHAWFLPWLLARWLQQPLTAVLRMTAAATPSLLLCLGVASAAAYAVEGGPAVRLPWPAFVGRMAAAGVLLGACVLATVPTSTRETLRGRVPRLRARPRARA